MPPRRYDLDTPTFRQTVVIIQTMPRHSREDLEAIKQRHLALGFSYQNDQIYRAVDAVTSPARQWNQRNRRSGRST